MPQADRNNVQNVAQLQDWEPTEIGKCSTPSEYAVKYQNARVRWAYSELRDIEDEMNDLIRRARFLKRKIYHAQELGLPI